MELEFPFGELHFTLYWCHLILFFLGIAIVIICHHGNVIQNEKSADVIICPD
jgi:hypothetical protein